jgi:hypothetical protein
MKKYLRNCCDVAPSERERSLIISLRFDIFLSQRWCIYGSCSSQSPWRGYLVDYIWLLENCGLRYFLPFLMYLLWVSVSFTSCYCYWRRIVFPLCVNCFKMICWTFFRACTCLWCILYCAINVVRNIVTRRICYTQVHHLCTILHQLITMQRDQSCMTRRACTVRQNPSSVYHHPKG